MKFKLWLLYAGFSFFHLTISAQTNPKTNAIYSTPEQAVFSGHIEGADVRGDSMLIILSRDQNMIFPTLDEVYGNVMRFKIAVDDSANFKFSIPAIDHPARLSLYVIVKALNANGRPRNIAIANDNIVEGGDAVFFNVYINKTQEDAVVNFSGYQGVDKYQCRYEVDSLWEAIDHGRHVEDMRQLYASNFETLYNDQFRKTLRGRAERMIAFIDQYKKDVSPLAFQLLRLDVLSKINWWYQLTMYGFGTRTEKLDTVNYVAPATIKKIAIFYRTHDEVYPIEKVISIPELKAYSLSYRSAELWRIITKLAYASGDFKKPDYAKLFEAVTNNYTGVLRERLIASVVTDGGAFWWPTMYTESQVQYYAERGLKIVKVPAIVGALTGVSRLAKGKPAYAFEFWDAQDRKVTLSDFKGQVILLDMWGTGCGACAEFHQKFEKEIAPKIVQPEAFKVISISTDKSKEQWQKSLKTNIYSSDNNVNVFTHGQGDNDAFNKYYNVLAAPFLLLVDKQGKVVARFVYFDNPDEIIRAINGALNG